MATEQPAIGGSARVVLRDALLVTVGCAIVAISINQFWHPRGIELVARKRYRTLVPCPEPGGEVGALRPRALRDRTRRSFVVDARQRAAFDRWHWPGAVNIPYDYLDPTPEEVLARLAGRIADSGAQRVVVYGDGDDPDTGEQLGKEISLSGIRHVFFVTGGVPALQGGEAR
jgi:hypothetical protein